MNAGPDLVRVVDYSNKWFVMACVASGTLLGTIDGSIINLALPVLEKELNTSFSTIQWVVLGYLLTSTTLLLSVGRLADMVGKKTIYISGFILFTVSSALCGLAINAQMLIGLRVIQAAGAVMMFALGNAILTEAFPENERGLALGVGGLMVSLGSISGPSLGGIILESFSWRWIFLVNVPIGIIGTIMVFKFVPDRWLIVHEKFDFPGSVSMFFCLLCFLLALTFGQQIGFFDKQVFLLFIFSFIFFGLFIYIEVNTKFPIINLSMFKNRQLSVNIITGFLTFVASSGSVLLMPFFLQNVMGYSPGKAGLFLITVPIAMGITAPIAGYLSDRIGNRLTTIFGLSSIIFGYILVSGLDQTTPAISYILRFLPIGIGMGVFQSPNNSAIMGSVSKTELGISSSLIALTRTTGQIIGISIMGAVWVSQIRLLVSPGEFLTATSASVVTQVIAFQRTIHVIIAVLIFSLMLSIWSFRQSQKVILKKS